MNELVLSLFPGIGLLDMAFEEEGFCVVRGPDLLWGGDIKRFHPPAGVFGGMIGGPPCQAFSTFAALARHRGNKISEDLISEFERCAGEAGPGWFLMENVPGAPVPSVDGYLVQDRILNNRWVGGVQNRKRRFSLGWKNQGPDEHPRFEIATEALEAPEWCSAVLASGGVKPGTEHKRGRRPGREYGYCTAAAFRHATRAQGMPEGWDLPGFTIKGKMRAIGNGVPLPMGRAVARAVRKALT